MHILIANVRNIRTNEIKVLAEALNKNHKITIISHMANKSNRGLAFSFRDEPIRVNPVYYKDVLNNTSWVNSTEPITAINASTTAKKSNAKTNSAFDGISAYEFAGDPADSISIMLGEILAHKRPDLVICGINNGRTMGQDIYCSSNVGMAMEATFFGIPTIAIGIDRKAGGHKEAEVKPVAEFIAKNVEKFASLKLPPHTFLNISMPSVANYKEYKGVKVARMGTMSKLSTYVEKVDPNGGKYYWANNTERKNADADMSLAPTWYEKGYITIVPLNYDATDHVAVREWDKRIGEDVKE